MQSLGQSFGQMFRNRLWSVIGLAVAYGTLAPIGAAADVEENKPPFAVKAVNWEEFKDRCVNYANYPDIQIPPQNIVFQCVDVQRDWVSDQPGAIPMPSYRWVRSGVISQKFSVADTTQEYMTANKGGSCLRFKEVERQVKLEIPLSCDDILGQGKKGKHPPIGNPVEYCRRATDSAKGANPKLVASRDTGRVIDTCPANTPVPNPNPTHPPKPLE